MKPVYRTLLAVALVGVAYFGVGGAGAQEVDRPRDRDLIARTLEARAKAVLERDREAFMATVDASSKQFVSEQERLFDAMEPVEFAEYELVARWSRFGDLARPSDRRHYPDADRVVIPLTEERYRLKGFDRSLAIEDMYFTFVKRDGEWRIAEDSDLNDLAFYSGRHLWDYGPIYSVHSPHFQVLAHRCEQESGANLCPDDARRFLTIAEEALQRVEGLWTKQWRKRVTVLVPQTPAELKRMLQVTFDPSDFVAFAYSTVDTRDGISYTGHRIVFNWRSFSSRSTEDVRTILAHELVHVASRDLAGPFIPIFVDEGVAEYIAHYSDPSALAFLNAEVANGIFDRRLPEDFEFITGDSSSIYRSYQEAQAAVRYMGERYGLPKFIDFYERVGVGLAPGTMRYHLNRALKRSIDMPFERFERDWADSIAG